VRYRLADVELYNGDKMVYVHDCVCIYREWMWCGCAQAYASDFNRFRMEEVPRRLKDKYHLTTLHDELKVRVNAHWLTPVCR